MVGAGREESTGVRPPFIDRQQLGHAAPVVPDPACPVSDDLYSPSCAFCAIVRDGAPANIVAETERTVAFLDRRPLFPGHTLLVPREHRETLPDLPVDQVGPLFAQARRLAEAMILPEGLGAEGSFVAINNTISQSVPHLHVHVVPRRRKDGLRGFFWPRTKYETDEHAADSARRVADALAVLDARA
jgi:histidine triad (HIT) family protein